MYNAQLTFHSFMLPFFPPEFYPSIFNKKTSGKWIAVCHGYPIAIASSRKLMMKMLSDCRVKRALSYMFVPKDDNEARRKVLIAKFRAPIRRAKLRRASSLPLGREGKQ